MNNNRNSHSGRALLAVTSRKAILASLFAGAVLSAGTAQAQDQATPAAANAGPVSEGEIVVTALKRSTRLQETPLAISAVAGDALQKAGTLSRQLHCYDYSGPYAGFKGAVQPDTGARPEAAHNARCEAGWAVAVRLTHRGRSGLHRAG